MSENKIALVTGGSRGLGKDMALSLAKKGLNVVLTYKSKKEEAESVVSEIENLGQKALALQLNTTEVKSFDSFIQNLDQELSTKFSSDKIDFLVNNAGFGIHTSFLETTEENFDDLMNVHFKGVFFLTQKLVPIINNGGGIVNISTDFSVTTVIPRSLNLVQRYEFQIWEKLSNCN